MYVVVDKSKNLNSFNNKIKKGPWLVWFYADWCGHCVHMKPEWEKLENECKNNKMTNVARVNDQMKDKLHNNIGNDVMGFPTIRLYNNGKLENEYSGERNNNSFMEFLLNKINTLKKNNKNASNSLKKSFNKAMIKKSIRVKNSNSNRRGSKKKASNKRGSKKRLSKKRAIKNKKGGFVRDKSVQHFRLGEK